MTAKSTTKHKQQQTFVFVGPMEYNCNILIKQTRVISPEKKLPFEYVFFMPICIVFE